MVDKVLSKIDTDKENDDAIADSIGNIRTEGERMAQVNKESAKGFKGVTMLGPQPLRKNE